TYRLMAEQTVDELETNIRGRKSPCRTATEPLLLDDASVSLSRIVPPPFSREAVEYYCRNEWALHIEDVMLRRGGWHHYEPARCELAADVAKWMGEVLDWNEVRI